MNVTIYSTPTCSYCKMAKEYFGENKVEFTEIDVSVDTEAAQKMVEKTGQMGVPVILVEKEGNEDVVVGFDKDKLAGLLGL